MTSKVSILVTLTLAGIIVLLCVRTIPLQLVRTDSYIISYLDSIDTPYTFKPNIVYLAGDELEHRNNSYSVDDILFSIKTSRKYHSDRIQLLLDTWIPQAANVFINTDTHGPEVDKLCKAATFDCRIGDSGCGVTHSRTDLVCKTGFAFEEYYKRQDKFKWFCIVDDDMYVVLPNLLKLLSNFNDTGNWYLGEVARPLGFKCGKTQVKYLTGAFICFSRNLANLMQLYMRRPNLLRLSASIDCPDDLMLGHIIANVLKVDMIDIPGIHSHLEDLRLIRPETLRDQVTLSYRISPKENVTNTININNSFPSFPMDFDPTRLKSFHCFMFPNSSTCKNLKL